MRSVVITESRPERIRLTASQAAALQEAGRRLASDRVWWGAQDASTDRTVIQCQRLTTDEWLVTVVNAVGIIALGDALQITVAPKIPEHHLLFLFSQSQAFPRFDDGRGAGAISASLWHLIAEWYVRACEQLLRHDLIRDYETWVEEIATVRGRLLPEETALGYYAGRTGVIAEFDEFDSDTALNRVLKAAARMIVASTVLPPKLRRRARALLLRMHDIGDLQPSDMAAAPDRRTGFYADALALARQVLRRAGRTFKSEDVVVWTFLIRTPELVEEGIRVLIRHALPDQTVTKPSLRLVPTTMTLNPDLVFGRTLAVADVKYKNADEQWRRSDLYQVTTFAVGFRVVDAAVIEFASPEMPPLPDVRIGDVTIRQILWPADPILSPREAALVVIAAVREWLALVPAVATSA